MLQTRLVTIFYELLQYNVVSIVLLNAVFRQLSLPHPAGAGDPEQGAGPAAGRRRSQGEGPTGGYETPRTDTHHRGMPVSKE